MARVWRGEGWWPVAVTSLAAGFCCCLWRWARSSTPNDVGAEGTGVNKKPVEHESGQSRAVEASWGAWSGVDGAEDVREPLLQRRGGEGYAEREAEQARGWDGAVGTGDSSGVGNVRNSIDRLPETTGTPLQQTHDAEETRCISEEDAVWPDMAPLPRAVDEEVPRSSGEVAEGVEATQRDGSFIALASAVGTAAGHDEQEALAKPAASLSEAGNSRGPAKSTFEQEATTSSSGFTEDGVTGVRSEPGSGPAGGHEAAAVTRRRSVSLQQPDGWEGGAEGGGTRVQRPVVLLSYEDCIASALSHAPQGGNPRATIVAASPTPAASGGMGNAEDAEEGAVERAAVHSTARSPLPLEAQRSGMVLERPWDGRADGGGSGTPEASAGWLEVEVVAGPCEGMRKRWEGRHRVTVGRLASNDVCIADDEVSGSHSVLECSSGSVWAVADCGSLNGTMLNDKVISMADRAPGARHELTGADTLQLGTNTRLRVTCAPPRRAAPPTGTGGEVQVMTADSAGGKLDRMIWPGARLSASRLHKVGRDHAMRNMLCEDVSSWVAPCDQLPGEAAVLCLMDGHLGRASAEQAAAALPRRLQARLRGQHVHELSSTTLQAAVAGAFLDTDDELRPGNADGCTATAVLLEASPGGEVTVWAANVGDSFALFIDLNREEMELLSEDHRISAPAEQQRLLAAGAPLSHNSSRVFGLNLARSLGDHCLKDNLDCIIAQPFLAGPVRVPAHAEALVVVASDGLWDVRSPEQVARIAVQADREKGGDASAIAKTLLDTAVRAHARDDVSIVVARISAADAA